MHEGHRERLRKKLETKDAMEPHEILESLLFNACPRKNTNPLAHALLSRFMTISGVLNASISELEEIDGVGHTVAAYLKTVGLCLNSMREEKQYKLKNVGDYKDYACFRMRGKTEEFLELYMVDASGLVIRTLQFTSNDENRVTVSSDKIVEALATVKPHGIAIAHNHLLGTSSPSFNDDVFTRRMQIICKLYNVKLLEHFIYKSDEDYFSYYDVNRFEAIRNDSRVNEEAGKF